MRNLLAIAGAVVLMGAAPVSAQSAYGFPWRGTVPVTITIADHTSADWRPYVEAAAAAWSLSPALEVVVKPSDGKCSTRAKLTICNGYAGLAARHAWTVYDSQNGWMTNADTTYNQSYVDGYVNPDGVVFAPYTADQRSHMACHEMGNSLGLLTDRACTFYDPFGGSAWETTPTEADYAHLLDIYGG